ncbi:hypothetical protein D3C86_1082160 [compost metagenome]
MPTRGIRRKKHAYRDGLRIYVNSQHYCWLFEAIKEAILDGTLTYTPKPAVKAHDLVSMETINLTFCRKPID